MSLTIAGLLATVGHWALTRAAKYDPRLSRIYVRHVRYQPYYPARPPIRPGGLTDVFAWSGGRVLGVNSAQRALTRHKTKSTRRRSTVGFAWRGLGGVAWQPTLITQRSLVQIQPPQPPKSKAWANPRLLMISGPFAATMAR